MRSPVSAYARPAARPRTLWECLSKTHPAKFVFVAVVAAVMLKGMHLMYWYHGLYICDAPSGLLHLDLMDEPPKAPPTSFSIVLPVNYPAVNIDRDPHGYFHNMIFSFHAFMDWNVVEDFWIVVRDEQVPVMEDRMRRYCREDNICGPFRIASEASIVPEFPSVWMDNWQKQQLIKLAMAQHVRTDHYLVVDTDVLLVQPVTIADLFTKDGRAKNDFWTLEATLGWRPKWVTDSELVLHMKLPREHADTALMMHVTPQMLHRDVVLRMGRHLEAVYVSNNWRRILFSNQYWIEFKMYHIYAQLSPYGNLIERYHEPAQLLHKLVMEGSVPQDAKESFKNKEDGIWYLFNDNHYIAAGAVWEKMAPLYPSEPVFPYRGVPRPSTTSDEFITGRRLEGRRGNLRS